MPAHDNDMKDRADTIAHDIERTQDDIGDTIDAIEEKLNPREIGRSLIGDEGVDVVREVLDITRRNPVPVAMIAIGSIWLLATSRSLVFSRIREGVKAPFSGGEGERAPRRTAPRVNPRPRTVEKLEAPRGALPAR